MQMFCSDYTKSFSFLALFSLSLLEGFSSLLSSADSNLQDTFCDAKLVNFIPVGRNYNILVSTDVGGISISAVA